MHVDEIRRLVKLVEESDIDELEVRRFWTVVRILKRGGNHRGESAPPVVIAAPAAAPLAMPVAMPAHGAQAPPVGGGGSMTHGGQAGAPAVGQSSAGAPAQAAVQTAPAQGYSAPAEAAQSAPTAERTAAEEGLLEIRSPMVGTFYRSANPNAPPYVEVGSRIDLGSVVCIVEAMKLMNEIEAEVSGTVARVLVQNGQPVEFSQPLFLVRPD